MKNIILIIFIGLMVSSCISIDPNSKNLSKNQLTFTENKSYIFSIVPSYSFKKDKSAIDVLARFFYVYDKDGKYIRITPKFNSQVLIAENLNEKKQVISKQILNLLPYSKENLDNGRESKTLYFNKKYEILKKSSYSVADLGQSWSYYTSIIFLDKDGNLVITQKNTEIALIFLIPLGAKTVSSNIFNKVG